MIKKPIIFNPHNESIIFNPYYYQAAFIDPGTVSCGVRIVRFYKETKRIELLYFNILNFGKEISEIMLGVNRELTLLLHIFINSHYIIIESQPLIRKDVFRCTQHIISFLSYNIKNKGVRGIIIEVDPKIKTVWIGGPATKKENGGKSIKDWSKQKAVEVSILRNDEMTLKVLSSLKYKAKEDLSDTVCYDYAFWSYMLIIKEIPK